MIHGGGYDMAEEINSPLAADTGGLGRVQNPRQEQVELLVIYIKELEHHRCSQTLQIR